MNEEMAKINQEVKVALSLIVIGLMIGLLGLVGIMQKEDNNKEESFYCKMVHEGVWPDYNKLNKQGKCPSTQEVEK